MSSDSKVDEINMMVDIDFGTINNGGVGVQVRGYEL